MRRAGTSSFKGFKSWPIGQTSSSRTGARLKVIGLLHGPCRRGPGWTRRAGCSTRRSFVGTWRRLSSTSRP
eukprot:8406825-Alexandrium_andersonii.AAC.1